ncbi:MAG TPA: TauD/TfdA family dioxygenase [Acidobacteriota bacterium]|nr:TauD/TfdA family dioxygenase [Acidobacteriota bacterium]
MPELRVDRLTPIIGAEIGGVDLSAPIDTATVDAVYDALMEHLVIFFRDQEITPESHLRFAECFGELDGPHPVYPHVEGFPSITLLENDAQRPPDTDDWYTDLTFKSDPPFAAVLFAHTVPTSGGDTLWTNMYAAYEAMPEDMRSLVDGSSAVHDMGAFRNDYVAKGGVESLNAAMANVGSAVHPVAPTHPVTGRRFLNVNRSFTRQILGLQQAESDRLLAYLFGHIDCPEFQVRFRWGPHSMAMWDNRVTQHYAVADYLPHYRRMHRVTVIKDKRAT